MDSTPQPRPTRRRLWGLFPAIWLVFLVNPTIDAFHKGGMGGTLTGLALIVFAGLYVLLMQDIRRYYLPSPWTDSRPTRWIALCLAIITAGLTVADTWPGLATMPFISVAAVVVFPRWSPLVILLVSGITELVSLASTGSLSDPNGVAIGCLISGGSVWAFTAFLSRNQALLRAKDYEAQLALVAERDRFARDLHDILGHSLTVISVKAELAGRLLDAGGDGLKDKARAEVADLERLARDALADVRATVSGYRELTLPGELAQARVVLTAAGIRAELPNSVEGVDSDLRELFAWAIREGVTNVVRHSGASTCTVTLGPRTMTVTDDGRGAKPTGAGSGLAGLNERAETFGAVVTTDSSMRGFVLRVSSAAPQEAMA